MKLRNMIVTSLLLTSLFSGIGMVTTVRADDNSSDTLKLEDSLFKKANQSGKKLAKLKLTGQWYNVFKENHQLVGEYISIGKDGSLNWSDYQGVGSNTTVVGIDHYHGWVRLKIRNSYGAYSYGFIKQTSLMIRHHKRLALFFALSKHKEPRKKQHVVVATKTKVALPNELITIGLYI